MTKSDFFNTCAIVLAAGRGTRMNAGKVNKVTLKIGGIPIIVRIKDKLKKAGINDIFVVVGHAKESVQALLENSVTYIEQKEQLGTGHAVSVACKKIPEKFENIFVFYGDDTSYDEEILHNLFQVHKKNNNSLTFLTIEVKDPQGLGRISRNMDGVLMGIVEEKDATPEEKKIKEVNPGCFIFKRQFLEKYIDKIPLNEIKNEYYLTDLIEIGIKNGEKVEAEKCNYNFWHGVNTADELKKADLLFSK